MVFINQLPVLVSGMFTGDAATSTVAKVKSDGNAIVTHVTVSASARTPGIHALLTEDKMFPCPWFRHRPHGNYVGFATHRNFREEVYVVVHLLEGVGGLAPGSERHT